MSTELATLAADPERVEDVDRQAIPGLIGEAAALHARLLAALQAPAEPVARPPSRNRDPDELLTVEQAAERLNVNTKWVYRHQAELPVRRLSSGTLRFSARGLERYVEARR